MRSLLILFLLGQLSSVHAYEKSDAFIIRAFDDRFKVLAPAVFMPELNVIIENKTMLPLVGKLQTLRGRVLKNTHLKSKGFMAEKLIVKKHERIFFVPLSPPGQEVELIIGKKSYEIPPQR